MEQKYILAKKKHTLVIKEVAQTEPGIFSLLYETELENTAVEEAIEKGNPALTDLFRSRHFYPVSFFANKLAEGIKTLFADDSQDSLKIEFNDNECLESKAQSIEAEQIENEKELAEIDKLLEDDEIFDADLDPSTTPEDKAGSVNLDDSTES